MKQIYVLISILIAGSIITGCSRKTFTLSDLNMNFNRIEVKEEGSGLIIPIEEDKAQAVYAMLRNINFVENADGSGADEPLYTLTFKNEEKVIQEFKIMDNKTMEYKKHKYMAKEGVLDLEVLEQLFQVTLHAIVLEAETSLLVQPVEGSSELNSADKIVISISEDSLFDAEGNVISLTEFETGDTIEVVYNGLIMESYPAQIRADSVTLVHHNYYLSGLMAVIEDIYEEDSSSLNEDITRIVFDMTELADLSEKEKQLLLTAAGYKYQVDTREGTYDDLLEEGILEDKLSYFEDGIIIKITNVKYDEVKNILTCGISKWRSPLGAVGSEAVTASYNGKDWSVTKEEVWIS